VKAFVNFMDRPRLFLSEQQLETLLDLLRGIEAEPPASPKRVWIETPTDRMELHWNPAQPFAFWVAGAMLSDGKLVGGWAEWLMTPGGPVLMQKRGITGFQDQILSTDVMWELMRAAASIPKAFLDRRVMELADRVVEQTKTESVPAFPAIDLEVKHGLRERVPFMGKSFSAEFRSMNSGVVYKQHLHIEYGGNPVVLEVQGSWSKHTNGIKVTLGPSKSEAKGSKHGEMIRKALNAAQAGIGRAVTDFLRSRSEFSLSVRANAEMRAAFYECRRHRVTHAGLLAARARVGEFEAELERIRTGFEYPCPS
jgi:hypothetical protein